MTKWQPIPEGVDAVFLPGKIHSAEHQAYIIYYNENANEGDGAWGIEVVDKDRILKLYEKVEGNADKFFGVLPDLFHGEWYYCTRDSIDFNDYEDIYWDADFIVGRDGDIHEEMMYLVEWAKSEE